MRANGIMLWPPDYRLFWGKTLHKADGSSEKSHWHPVAWHMMDVAAVAEMLLRTRRPQVQRLARILRIEEEALIRLCTFLVGLHDVGKFSAAFQSKAPAFWPEQVLGVWRSVPDVHHTLTGYWALQGELMDDLRQVLALKEWEEPHSSILAAITGHHGTPPVIDDIDNQQFGEEELLAARNYIRDFSKIIEPEFGELIEKEALQKHFSFWLAGLCVVSDWIGSNETLFPFKSSDILPEVYWNEHARPQAAKAVHKVGMLPVPSVQEGDYRRFFHIDTPRPLQDVVSTVDLPEGPVLVIIEDATGSGKTEAAALLAWRMMRAGKASGLYFALPTMATANAMYARFADIFHRFFDERQGRPSLALAHGRRDLNPHWYKTLQLARIPVKEMSRNGDEPGMGATCAAWIADDRRKTFFAHVGVGTIDQALLAVLPARFQALRLHGLSDRVLIVDEAHAYDSYMSRELETLLRFHAAQGGSAIVLSATLPQERRSALATAFFRGLQGKTGEKKALTSAGQAYPLITLVSEDGLREKNKISPARHTVRRVIVERAAEENSVLTVIQEAVARGAAVAWVRNAVDDAIAAVLMLREHGIAAQLFHARFAMGDRLRIEEDVLRIFGKHAGASMRRGKVLVATQVIEQSLDLDFDLIISDLAPVDLLIQRAGRLWRHMDVRPGATRPFAEPKLFVLSPDPNVVNGEDWYQQLGLKGAFVYRDHALLWRTAKVLFDTGVIDAPHDLRRLIESVYGEERSPTPEPLQRYDDEALAGRYADESIANYNLLSLDDGYIRIQTWLDEDRKPTRLGEPTRVLRLARIDNGQLVPWCRDDAGRPSWALSEVSVPATWVKEIQVQSDWQAQAEAIRREWPKWEADIILAPVNSDGKLILMNANGEQENIYYDYLGLHKNIYYDL